MRRLRKSLVTSRLIIVLDLEMRTEEDRQAIRIGLQDGTFDAIATDHAPHSEVLTTSKYSV